MYPKETIGVNIITVDEMEGLNFALRYFDEPEKLYISPSIAKKLETTPGDVQFVVMSWNSTGRDIKQDAVTIINQFKKSPSDTNKRVNFSVTDKLNEYVKQNSKERRIIVSPLFEIQD
jgi:hypothetical protein